jgi:prepilin signal peptidase PulO-like enzyme (type II secretory pathway)
MWSALLVAAFFACLAYLSVHASAIVCRDVTPFEDGPSRHQPPIPLLIGGSALIGALIVVRGAEPFQVSLAALVLIALVGAWCSDSNCGVVPDVFTLGPLGAITLFLLIQQQWRLLLWAAVPLIPFAVAAAVTRGRGMGWGDVKLSAFAGLVLGAPLALVTLACACLLAALMHRFRRMRPDHPIAFAPYIAGTIALALPLGVVR